MKVKQEPLKRCQTGQKNGGISDRINGDFTKSCLKG